MGTRLIWHGYLLTSTGSNLYTSNIARTWAAAGHTVIVMAQEHRPEQLPDVIGHARVSAAGLEWVSEEPAPDAAGCILVTPDIGGVLPVYVMDRYEGFDVHRVVDMNDAARESYMHANRVATEQVLDRWPGIEAALINHAALGPEALRPALQAAGVPYAVKIHGSELEYALAEDATLIPIARSGLAGADRLLAGSSHIATRASELLGVDFGPDPRMRVVPPGVDMDLFQPLPPGTSRDDGVAALAATLGGYATASSGFGGTTVVEAYAAASATDAAGLAGACDGLASRYQERDVDADAAHQVRRVLGPDAPPAVTYVGKFISQKGPHLTLLSMPLVRAAHPGTPLIMAGFGPLRCALAALVGALDAGDLDTVASIAVAGSRLDGGTSAWDHAVALLEQLEIDDDMRATYLRGCEGFATDTAWLGCVGHDVLAELWPVTAVTHVPSIFPEAFGMVAAEAAAAGSLPVVSDHTGLGEVGAALSAATGLRHTFASGSVRTAIPELAARTESWLSLDPAALSERAAAARACVQSLWSWTEVAEATVAGLGVDAGVRH